MMQRELKQYLAAVLCEWSMHHKVSIERDLRQRSQMAPACLANEGDEFVLSVLVQYKR